jgi:hypothetical protein
VLSFVAFYGFLLVYCGVYNVFGTGNTELGMYWILMIQFTSPQYWSVLFITLAAALVPPWLVTTYIHSFTPSTWRLVQRAFRLPQALR